MTTMTLGTRTYQDPDEFPVSTLLGPSRKVEPVTPGVALVNGPCKKLWVGAAGTLNFTDFDGNVHTGFPALAGENPIMAQSVEAGGTATNIWAMY